MPFINKYHKIEDIVFWPDLGTSHYKKCVIDWYRSHNIDFVEKNENPPNYPQIRPIERFWSECKKAYKKRKESAKSSFPQKDMEKFELKSRTKKYPKLNVGCSQKKLEKSVIERYMQ